MATTMEIHTQVSQLYTALFGRAPDAGGLGFWTGLLAGGQSLLQVADTMYATEPARVYYPAYFSSQDVIASFYLNVLGREADTEGLGFWTAKLSAPGATPGAVILELIETVANYRGTHPDGLISQQLFNNKVTVAQYYAEAGGGVASATAILSAVTADEDTVTAAIDLIDTVGVDAPMFSSASVNGPTLVMTYVDDGLLDATHVPSTSAFTVKVNGVTRTVSAVAVDADDKTVTLTLSKPVVNGETVTVAYADPTDGNDANAIQDAAGHDAASLSATAVTNDTAVGADFTAPVFSKASVVGVNVILTYTDASMLDSTHVPAVGAFTVRVGGVEREVSAVEVNASAKTVTLTLESAVANGESVTVAYADPTSGNDVNAIQDASGNDAASLSEKTATNNTPDTTAPVFASATVNGTALVMTYTELNGLDDSHIPATTAFTVKVAGADRTVDSVAVNTGAKTVTLTLASAVTNGQTVTVAYADPTTGNDTNAIQDASGNDAASLAATTVTNSTPAADTTAPVFASAAVNGASLVMTYTEANALDAANPPSTSAFAVTVASVARSVSAVTVDASAKTVTLTLASAVAEGEAVTVAYTDPTGGNDVNAIQDASGNDASTLGATTVTNNTPDTTAPVFESATVNGTSLVLTYSDLHLLDDTNIPVAGAFVVLVDSIDDTVNTVVVDAAAKTVTLTLATAVTAGQTVTVTYTDPTAGNDTAAIQDATGNDAASLAAATVTNETAALGADPMAGLTGIFSGGFFQV
jgi:uncharacterized repeat protein (TIGR02059 family)